jgi:hypothetical protein
VTQTTRQKYDDLLARRLTNEAIVEQQNVGFGRVELEGIAGQLREGRDSMKFVEMIKSNIQIKNSTTEIHM